MKDVFEFAIIAGAGNAGVVQYLQQRGLLCSVVQCAPCGRPFTQVKQQGTVFGVILRCPGCRRKMSLAKDSMFTDLKMEATKLLGLLYFWGCHPSAS